MKYSLIIVIMVMVMSLGLVVGCNGGVEYQQGAIWGDHTYGGYAGDPGVGAAINSVK